MSQWSLQPIFSSYAVVAGVAIALALLLIIGPTYRRLTVTQRTALVALRLAVIVLVAVAMLRPTHVSTTSRRQTAVLVVLFDQSRSMQLPNAVGRETRWEAQLAALRKSEPELAALADDLELKFYAYDSQLRTIDFDGRELKLPDSPDGGQTDIGTTLQEAVRRELGKRLAGVVLLGDGAQTAFDPKTEIQEAGREIARLDYPIYTVAFGPPASAAQSRDVSVENLPEQYSVFVKNELLVRAQVRVSGYVNQTIPVELVLEDSAGSRETVGRASAVARGDNELVPVEFTFAPQQPGSYQLVVQAAEQPGELVTTNNQLNAFLTVLEGGLRVLYVEGEPRQEQLFLRRAINDSADMQLDFRWIEQRARDRWPVDMSREFGEADYDVIMLGDVDSAAFRPEDLRTLAARVESGKGLMMLGGYHSFGPGGYQDTPLKDVLPITFDRFERQDFDAPIRDDLHLPGPLAAIPARSHSVTRLAAADQNSAVWRELRPLKGANRFAGVKEAAGVQVLLESRQGDPLLVSGEVGAGRVLAFAGDSTWQWWRQGWQDIHKRFWRQVILWLTHREDLQREDVWIRMNRRRVPPGVDVEFQVGARTSAGDEVANAEFTAKLLKPDGSTSDLRLSRTGDSAEGSVGKLAMPGKYTVEITARTDGREIGRTRANLQVMDQDIELSNPAADPDQLARLAALTKEAGGRAIAAEALPDLFSEIHQRPPDLEIEVETKWQFPDRPRDAWSFLLVFVALLTGEWALRKRWGLV
ncbi:MAG: glutamine amidotransferase [Pirellulaceae bacterium]